MRRSILTALVGGSLALGTGLFMYFWSGSAHSEDPKAPAYQAVAKGGSLPISQVVLFSSGVGYFQREGEIVGSNRIDLTFQSQDINDLLKSMVLQDLGGGHVSAVSYDSQAPVEKTLRSFAINLTNNPTFGQILNQGRGEKIEAILQQTTATQPGNLTGVIMGVEKQRQAVGKEIVEAEMLNLWCAEGMRSIKLADVQRIRFLNPVMDSEVKKALETLALSHDTQKKAVSLSFAGEGKRSVKVGYVVENPIWKTSYRLVLDAKNKPFLQGWAVVENTQDEDWTNVRMALVSGRPISFQMDLYQPLFVTRPVVEPELFASLRPPTYTGAMEKQLSEGPKDRSSEDNEGRKPEASSRPAPTSGYLAKPAPGNGHAIKALMDEKLDLNKGIASAAAAMELGDFFQYLIERPVNLPRQKSAMLPIVNQEVEASRVSIYNQGTHVKFPLHGLKFKNTTKLHLMQGPITIFDGARYAGDARILDLQPKEERLISYAIDLGTEVEPVVVNSPDRIIKIKINKGILEATHEIRQSMTYNVKNRSEHDRLLIIEHPFRQEFKLLTPEKPAERARDVYRFELKMAAGKTAKQEVVEEQDVLHRIQISNTDDQSIHFFLQNAVTSDKVKKVLEKAIAEKVKLSATQRDLGLMQRKLDDIRNDQVRLRANLKEMPPTAAAYKRYLDKFDKQETEIEQLMENIKKLQETEHQQRNSLDTFLAAVDVE